MEAEKGCRNGVCLVLPPSVKVGLGWSGGSQGALSALSVWVTGDHKSHQEQRMERQGNPWRTDPGMHPPSRGAWAQGEILKPSHPSWQVEFRLRRGSVPWAPVPAVEIGQLGLQWQSSRGPGRHPHYGHSFLPAWVWLPRTQPNRLHLACLWASCRLPWDGRSQEQAAA